MGKIIGGLDCLLVKGPKELADDVVTWAKAVNRAQEIVHWAQRALALRRWGGTKDEWAELWRQAPVSLRGGALDSPELERLTELDPMVFVDDLVESWPLTTGDAFWRDDSDLPGQIITVVGCRLWGSRQAGVGYRLLKTAQALDLFPIFGLR